MAGGSQGAQTADSINAIRMLNLGRGTATPATTAPATPTARAYENLYGLMLAPPTAAYVPQAARSNYDPTRAQRMADMSLAYQKAGATANTEGYNKSMQALQSQKDAIAAQKAAEEAAAQRAALANQRNRFGFGFFGGGDGEAAQGGLASLQGFIR